ncbi:MAG: hypothetical protein ABI876_00015 [Bacteroidota bacterium]
MMENEKQHTEGEETSVVFAFKLNRTYDIGTPRACDTNDVKHAKLITTGKYRMRSVMGSTLIAEGIRTVDEFFKRNPLMMPEERPLSIYEIDPLTGDRTFIAGGSVLPSPVAVAPPNTGQPKSIGDPKPAEANRTAFSYIIPFFTLDKPREDPVILAEQRAISTLHDKLCAELIKRENEIEQSQHLMEQILQQSRRMVEQLNDTIKETVRSRDQASQRLAGAEAQLKAILKLKEFEEKIQKEREEERAQRWEQERELAKARAEKKGLGEARDQLLPFAPIIQTVLERFLPPINPYEMPRMEIPRGGMPPGGMPSGMMQNVNTQQGTPMRHVHRPSPNSTNSGEARRTLNAM